MAIPIRENNNSRLFGEFQLNPDQDHHQVNQSPFHSVPLIQPFIIHRSSLSDRKTMPRFTAADQTVHTEENGVASDSSGFQVSTKFLLILLILVAVGALFSLISLSISAKNKSDLSSIHDYVKSIYSKPVDRDHDIVPQGSPKCSSATIQQYGIHEWVDCQPERPFQDQSSCESRGCCWRNKTESNYDANKDYDSLKPNCLYPKNFIGYSVDSVSKTDFMTTIRLTRSSNPSGFKKDINNVHVVISYLNENSLRIKITDSDNLRFEPELPILKINQKRFKFDPKYSVDVISDGLLTVTRKSSGSVLFKTDLKQLIFSDQFLQLTSSDLSSSSLYGLGEHFEDFRKTFDDEQIKRYTFLTSDMPPEQKSFPGYGHQPFYLMVEDDNHKVTDSHSVLLFNGNIMDILMKPGKKITYRPIGGVLDFLITLGDTPKDVISQHIKMIGLPDLPPIWSLGFQISRYGYKDLNDMKDTLKRNLEHIPVDVMWNDIETLDGYKDFTIDKEKFAGLPDYIQELKAMNIKYIPLVDASIEGKDDNYPTLDDGLKGDVFIRNDNGTIYEGKVWNKNISLFPDFTHPNTSNWWSNEFRKYHNLLGSLDGAWIDMNEPANWPFGVLRKCDETHGLNSPEYIPGYKTEDRMRWASEFNRKTVCMSSKQYAGTHYDLHNLYGLYEAKATKE